MENISVYFGYNGDDFATQSVTCKVQSSGHTLTVNIKGFFKYGTGIQSRLVIYKALKEFGRLNEFTKTVNRLSPP